jgi:hypothetical protein
MDMHSLPPSGGFSFLGHVMDDIKDTAAFKEAVKQAIKEWLNEQFAAFGRWTFYGLCSMALGGMTYLALTYFTKK